jgi:hypothetical protein
MDAYHFSHFSDGYIESRLKTSTLSCVQILATDHGFSLFQSTNFGDLFVQDFFRTDLFSLDQEIDFSWRHSASSSLLKLDEVSTDYVRNVFEEAVFERLNSLEANEKSADEEPCDCCLKWSWTQSAHEVEDDVPDPDPVPVPSDSRGCSQELFQETNTMVSDKTIASINWTLSKNPQSLFTKKFKQLFGAIPGEGPASEIGHEVRAQDEGDLMEEEGDRIQPQEVPIWSPYSYQLMSFWEIPEVSRRFAAQLNLSTSSPVPESLEE